MNFLVFRNYFGRLVLILPIASPHSKMANLGLRLSANEKEVEFEYSLLSPGDAESKLNKKQQEEGLKQIMTTLSKFSFQSRTLIKYIFTNQYRP